MSSAVLRVLSQRLPYPANLKRILLQQHWFCDKCALKNLATSAYVFQVQKPATEDSGKEIDIQRERPYAHLSFGEKGKTNSSIKIEDKIDFKNIMILDFTFSSRILCPVFSVCLIFQW